MHCKQWVGLSVQKGLVIGLVVCLAACDGAVVKLPEVKGVLTVNDKPVPRGTITFYPDATKGNKSHHQPIGIIGPDGQFELFVSGGKKGAPLGWYKVTIYAVDDPQPGKPNKYLVHKKYTDLASTPLSLEVVENPDTGHYDRKLDR